MDNRFKYQYRKKYEIFRKFTWLPTSIIEQVNNEKN